MTAGDLPGTMGDALPYVDLPPGVRVKDFKSAAFHACVQVDVLPDSPILQTQNASDPLANVTDRVYCWGFGGSGRLITADIQNIGLTPGSLGLNMTAAKLPPNFGSKRMFLGSRGTWFLYDDGKAYGFGYNAQDALGLSNLDADRQGYNSTTVYDAIQPANLGSFLMSDLLVGRDAVCGVDAAGRMKCWGTEIFGECFLPLFLGRFSTTCVLSAVLRMTSRIRINSRHAGFLSNHAHA